MEDNLNRLTNKEEILENLVVHPRISPINCADILPTDTSVKPLAEILCVSKEKSTEYLK